jgi:hypothetical protein
MTMAASRTMARTTKARPTHCASSYPVRIARELRYLSRPRPASGAAEGHQDG